LTPSLTSKSSLSFEARDLKVWIQTASSLAKNAQFGFFLFCHMELRNEGFTKLTNMNGPQISQAPDKISKS